MFNLFKKNQKRSWGSYENEQKQEVIDGKLVLTISQYTMVEDLNESVAKFMRNTGMDKKYKVVISEIENNIELEL
ncbi:hypothetical protein [Sporosarcina sp. FSL W7-1283]|uniref:hypothetical protein n=1 Tax=Sporosarcina sp. FSL W7-1283 TaxID=2921560 RepID=UPI0030FBFD02